MFKKTFKKIKYAYQSFKCGMSWCQPPFGFTHSECEIIKKLSHQSYLIRCKHCGRLFGINYSARVVLPWSHELKTFYEDVFPEYQQVDK